MTKKDSILLARVMKETKPVSDQSSSFYSAGINDQWECIVRKLAKELSLQNNAFNFDTFYKACGLEPFNLKSSGK